MINGPLLSQRRAVLFPMFDGLKIVDVSVRADVLLNSDRLTFPLPIDEKTRATLDRPRYAKDKELTFGLVPRFTGGYRVELKGSIHRYGREGRHNADNFTTADLLATLDELITTYRINPFSSLLNNIEFGVNVRLPFPVSVVLNNLVGYKRRPFAKETGNGFAYYQCKTQRYIIKLYDKGKQYNLSNSVLRVEIKVLKMEQLKSWGVQLNTLADLLIISNYKVLGAVLVETFNKVLFDEPTVNESTLTGRNKDIYQNGRNPHFWLISDHLTGKERASRRKALQRAEKEFRDLINRHRKGNDWQSQTATLIGKTWEHLTRVDDSLRMRIDQHLSVWRCICPENVPN